MAREHAGDARCHFVAVPLLLRNQLAAPLPLFLLQQLLLLHAVLAFP